MGAELTGPPPPDGAPAGPLPDARPEPASDAEPAPEPQPEPEPAPPARAVTTGRGGPPRRLLRGSEQLQGLVGRRLLVGITVRDIAGAIRERRQFYGTVTDVADGVVVLRHDDGTAEGREVLLPADPHAYSPAPPGTYRLPSGVVVTDPDYLSTWDVLPGPDTAPH